VIVQAMPWQSMAIEVPCYNEPLRCAQRANIGIHAFEKGEPLPNTDMLWLTSPSNPSGELAQFPHDKSGVLDESYMPFSQRKTLGLIDNVIRLGSLTKTFCIPGLRLGYVVADKASIEQLQQWLAPWPASTLALHVLPKLLDEVDTRDAYIEQARTRLMQLLTKHGWISQPSHASFILAKPPHAMPDFKAHHILVRFFPEWAPLAGWVRLGLPNTESDWQRLDKALSLSA
jgi:histidinol-phosphate/aromatic aminotransferase/cobyric acid decarboxylase-like protein